MIQFYISWEGEGGYDENLITIKKAKICYSINSNCHRICLIQHKSRKVGVFFKANCSVMDGDLRRLKEI